MSVRAAPLESSYDIHGVGLVVAAREPAVLEALEQRLRTFACEPGADPQIRIEFVSGDDVAAPALPSGDSRPVYDTPYGEVFYSVQDDVLFGDVGGVRLRCDAGAGVARVHSAAFEGRDLYLATHPLVTISLMELLERRGRYSLHAACLARDGRGVLMSGPSGAGKSTLALALVRAGLDFLSDDVVFLDDTGATVRALGFADALGVTATTARRFDELTAALDEPPRPGFPKRLVRIDDAFAAVAHPSCVPALLVFPQVVRDRPAALQELDGKEAWLRLVPDVLLTDPATTQSHLRALAAMLDQVRCCRLQSGADLELSAQLVVDALDA